MLLSPLAARLRVLNLSAWSVWVRNYFIAVKGFCCQRLRSCIYFHCNFFHELSWLFSYIEVVSCFSTSFPRRCRLRELDAWWRCFRLFLCSLYFLPFFIHHLFSHLSCSPSASSVTFLSLGSMSLMQFSAVIISFLATAYSTLILKSYIFLFSFLSHLLWAFLAYVPVDLLPTLWASCYSWGVKLEMKIVFGFPR